MVVFTALQFLPNTEKIRQVPKITELHAICFDHLILCDYCSFVKRINAEDRHYVLSSNLLLFLLSLVQKFFSAPKYTT
jgi:hypothetical protein